MGCELKIASVNEWIHMRKLLHKHTISFRHAIDGLHWAFRTQPNFRIHFTLSLLVIIAGVVYHISYSEMTLIIFAIILGLSAELINTALEAMTDLLTPEWHEQAKIAKDVSAGMMLFTAFGAVLIASFIFLPIDINSI